MNTMNRTLRRLRTISKRRNAAMVSSPLPMTGPLSADVRAISASSRPPPPTSMALIGRPSAYSAGSVPSASLVRTVTASPFTTTSVTPGSFSSSDGSGAGVLKRSVLVAVNALIWAGVPSAMTRPWFTTMIRVALASASSR